MIIILVINVNLNQHSYCSQNIRNEHARFYAFKVDDQLKVRTLIFNYHKFGFVSNMSSDKTYRICISSEESEDLFSPCRCRGSMAYVHRHCLKDWIEISGRSACEVCGQQWKSGVTINKIINFTNNNIKIFIGTLSFTLLLAIIIVYLNLFKYECQNIFNIDSTNKCKFLNTFLFIDYSILFCFDIYGILFFGCLFLKFITKKHIY